MTVVNCRVVACCGVRLFGGTSWTSTPMDWVDRKEWTTWRGRRGSTTSWRASGRPGSATRTSNLSVGMFLRTCWGRTGLIRTMQAQKTVHIWPPSQTCSPHSPSHIHRCVEVCSQLVCVCVVLNLNLLVKSSFWILSWCFCSVKPKESMQICNHQNTNGTLVDVDSL